MTEVIQAIFIRESDTRQQPKPHTIYKVQVHAAVRNWTVWKRYSEFKKLHDQLVAIYPKYPPPVSFPGKSLFPSTFGDAQKIEDRRRRLEDYVRGILSDRDDRWRQTDVWRGFLAIPTGRPLEQSYTSESWLDEYQDMTQAARETRSLINKRATHIARNEISASHNCTMQAKKLVLTLATRLSTLEGGLHTLATGSWMSEGELRRRQDMLNTLKDEKDALLKLVSTGRQDHDLLYTPNNTSSASSNNGHVAATETTSATSTSTNYHSNSNNNNKGIQDRNALLGDKETSMVQRNSSGGRAFGAAFKQNQLAKETEVTRGLDNEGIVHYQQQLMEDQDQQVEQFSAILNRQKQLGYAIGDELETQNQMLDELDRDGGRTQTKMKFANKKLAKIK
jgi:regulator of vacuolar morphogenesis